MAGETSDGGTYELEIHVDREGGFIQKIIGSYSGTSDGDGEFDITRGDEGIYETHELDGTSFAYQAFYLLPNIVRYPWNHQTTPRQGRGSWEGEKGRPIFSRAK